MADLKKMYKTIMDDDFPDQMTIQFGDQVLVYKKRVWKIPDEKSGDLIEKGLRYGENPDQQAALYELVHGNLVLGKCKFIEPGNGLVSSITEEQMIQAGKHPGKTNLTDLDNALNILKFLSWQPAATIMKHNNPCGVALGETVAEAYARANMADRIAAFGGCLVINQPMDKTTAEMVSGNYLEVVGAPEFEEGTVEILSKRKNLRIVRIDGISTLEKFRTSRFVDLKCLIDGGIIVQQSPVNRIKSVQDFLPATTSYKGKEYAIARQPTENELKDMYFGWMVEQGVTSNSVIFVKDGCTVGIGTGEQDRVGVAEIAAFKAYIKYADSLCFKKHSIPLAIAKQFGKDGHYIGQKLIREIEEQSSAENGGLIGSTMVSDAFFPFRDGVDVGLTLGIIAIVQPGGSERDFEVIEACNEKGATMVFTGQRCFKH